MLSSDARIYIFLTVRLTNSSTLHPRAKALKTTYNQWSSRNKESGTSNLLTTTDGRTMVTKSAQEVLQNEVQGSSNPSRESNIIRRLMIDSISVVDVLTQLKTMDEEKQTK